MSKDREIFIPGNLSMTVTIKVTPEGCKITVKDDNPEVVPLGGDPGTKPPED